MPNPEGCISTEIANEEPSEKSLRRISCIRTPAQNAYSPDTAVRTRPLLSLSRSSRPSNRKPGPAFARSEFWLTLPRSITGGERRIRVISFNPGIGVCAAASILLNCLEDFEIDAALQFSSAAGLASEGTEIGDVFISSNHEAASVPEYLARIEHLNEADRCELLPQPLLRGA